MDNITCYSDQGQYCNATGISWCNINVDNISYCSTADNQYCQFLDKSGWYLTVDGYNLNTASALYSVSNATYCYSQDGQVCYSDYGSNCDQQSSSYCSYDETGMNLVGGTYCASSDNQTCVADSGAFCNNS